MPRRRETGGLDTLDDEPPVERCRGKERLYTSTSLCLLPGHEPRKSSIRFVEHPWFDPFILLTILANCSTMAWQSPLDPTGTQKEAVLDVFEWVFLIIFTTEMLSKILAYGFIGHKNAYLHDPWCQLDFVVVSLAWLPILFPTMGNYSVLRAFRALRPLRALKRVPGMPVLVQWILSVMPKMGNVAMLCGFVFLVFGIVGMELFKGALHYRCALPGFVETPGHPVEEGRRRLAALEGLLLQQQQNQSQQQLQQQQLYPPPPQQQLYQAQPPPQEQQGVLALSGVPQLLWSGASGFIGRALKGAHADMGDAGSVQDPYDTGLSCSLAGIESGTFGTCPAGTSCMYFDANPTHGINSFDSVAMVFIAFIQAVTFDDWAAPMYALMAAFSPLVWVYFVLIVMIAGFFVVNLFLAVIFLEFGNAQAQIKADQEAARTQRTHRSVESGDSPTATRRSGSSSPAGKHVSVSTPLLEEGVERSDGTDGSKVGCCDLIGKIFLPIAMSDALGNFSTLLVLLNMVLMCMPYEGMPQSYADGLENAATAISWIFIVEMAIKLLGMGCAEYWSDSWNCLDGTIVSLSIFEMIMTALASGTGVKLSFLRMLRMLRVLRILRLMRKWKGLYKIIKTFIQSIPHMSNLVFLILLTMFMFSLLGMQLFGGIFEPSTGYSMEVCPGHVCADGLQEKPYYHFDYCYPAMLTVFILLTGEWIDAMEPVAAILGPACSLFFIFTVLLGKYLLMNLLVAVILTEFAEDEEVPNTARSEGAATDRSGGPDTGRQSARSDTARSTGSEGQETVGGQGADDGPKPWPADHSLFIFGPQNPLRRLCRWAIKQPKFDQVVILAIIVSSICLALDSPRLDKESDLAHALKKMDLFFTVLFFCEMSTKIVSMGFACNGKESYIRSAWNQVDFVIVMISLVVLLAESVPQLRPLRVLRVMRVLRPLRLISRNAGMKLIITTLFQAMPAVGNVFGVIFVLQIVFVILGMQLLSGTFATCNNPQILQREMCIDNAPPSAPGVAFSGYVPEASDGRRLQASIDYALPFVGPAPVWAGASHAAEEAAARRALKGGGGAVWDGSEPLRWTNPVYGSFDNFADGMRLLYIMSSGDQWELPLFDMMGASEPGYAPVRNDFSPMAAFAFVWMFVGYVFAINLFVGVVVDNFSRMQKEHDGSATMTQEQKQWATTMKGFANMVPTKAMRPPANPIRRCLYRLINSTAFDGFITGVIVANIGIMACDYWGIEQDEDILRAYERAMDVFSMIYYVEFVIKITALGCGGYFSDPWCQFDFFLVCSSLLDQFASELLAQFLPIPPMLLRVMRILRILRILRLLKGAKELRDLIVTMVLSFPSLLNVGSLLALVIFIYSVLGVNMFTFIAHGDPIADAAAGINGHRNFDTFNNAFLLLFQCLTGDGWSSVMADAMKDEASGKCSLAEGNCGSPTAIPYFITFQVVGSFIFLNLVVAVILENFANLYFTSPDLVSNSDLEVFSEAWQEFDPDATNYMPLAKLPDLLHMVPKPLGAKGKSKKKAMQLCFALKIPQRNGNVAFQEVVKALIEHNFLSSGALDEDAVKEVAPGVEVPMLKLRTPPPPSRGDDDDDDFAGTTAAQQETIAEVFAMAKMFQEDVKDAFLRSLSRARDRIRRGVKGGFHGLTKEQQEKRDAIIRADREEAAAEEAAAEEAAAKQEPAKQEPAKQEPAKQEPAKQEPAKQEPAKQVPAKQEPAKQVPAKQGAATKKTTGAAKKPPSPATVQPAAKPPAVTQSMSSTRTASGSSGTASVSAASASSTSSAAAPAGAGKLAKQSQLAARPKTPPAKQSQLAARPKTPPSSRNRTTAGSRKPPVGVAVQDDKTRWGEAGAPYASEEAGFKSVKRNEAASATKPAMTAGAQGGNPRHPPSRSPPLPAPPKARAQAPSPGQSNGHAAHAPLPHVGSNRYNGTGEDWQDPLRYNVSPRQKGLLTPKGGQGKGGSPGVATIANGAPDEAGLREKLLPLFQKLDEDGSGLVSAVELQTMVRLLNMGLNEAEVDAMVKQADPDGNGQLSFDEFVAAILRQAREGGGGGGLAAVVTEASGFFGWLNPLSWFEATRTIHEKKSFSSSLPAEISQRSPPSGERPRAAQAGSMGGRPPRSADLRGMRNPGPSAAGRDGARHRPACPSIRHEDRSSWVSHEPFEPAWGDCRAKPEARPPSLLESYHESRRQQPARADGLRLPRGAARIPRDMEKYVA